MEITKTCSKCGEVKAVEMFVARRCQCKVCTRAAGRAWREKNSAYQKEYFQKNKMKLLAQQKCYVQKNRKKTNEYKSKWQKSNPDVRRASAKKRKAADEERFSERSRAANKKSRSKLNDGYVAEKITKQTCLARHLITPELIEVKRKHLQLLRKIKELTND